MNLAENLSLKKVVEATSGEGIFKSFPKVPHSSATPLVLNTSHVFAFTKRKSNLKGT